MTKAIIVANFVLKCTIGLLLIGAFFMFIPITISLPNSLVEFLTSGAIAKVFQMITFFVPIKFLVECFLFIIIIKNSSIVFNAVVWVYNKIKDLG